MIANKDYVDLDISLLEMELAMNIDSNEILTESTEVINEGLIKIVTKTIIFIKKMVRAVISFFRNLWSRIYSFFMGKHKFVIKHEKDIKEGSLHIEANKEKSIVITGFYTYLNFGTKTMLDSNLIMKEIVDTKNIVSYNTIDHRISTMYYDEQNASKMLRNSKKEVFVISGGQSADGELSSIVTDAISFFKNDGNINKVGNSLKMANKSLENLSLDAESIFKHGDYDMITISKNKDNLMTDVKAIINVNKNIMKNITESVSILSKSHWEVIQLAYSNRYDKKYAEKVNDSLFNMNEKDLKNALDNIDYNKTNVFTNPFFATV